MPEPQLTEYQLHMMQTADTALGVLVLAATLIVFLVTVAVVRHL